MAEQLAVRETVPMWLAIALTLVVSMPFGLWLGKYNFALWCSFIVWAEYFTLGAKPAALKLIIPSFSYAAALTALTLLAIPWFSFLPSILTDGDLAATLVLFAGVAFMSYTMRWAKTFQEGSLPFFNGISMTLAVYFTNSYPKIGPAGIEALVAGGWTILMGVFGALLGMFNVWLTFPRESR
jgi:hypothetical protein